MPTAGAARLPGILTVLLLTAGCAGTPVKDPRANSGIPQLPSTDAGGHIAELALSMVGVQYRYGGANPSDGRFVHAPSSGSSVRVANIDAPYYQRNLVAVGRLLP